MRFLQQGYRGGERCTVVQIYAVGRKLLREMFHACA
jgi:hypothetical protein